MARIKDRQLQIPGGYRWFQPETGWRSPQFPSFDTLIRLVIEHRRANPFLAKQNRWKMTPEEVAEEMDAYNAKICVEHGWLQYVTGDAGGSAFPKQMLPPQLMSRNVSDGVAAVKVGARIISSWLGEGGKPVAHEEAERRAAICATCPQNDRGDWTRFFTQPASELIRKQLGAAKDLSLTTSKDAELQICAVCACPLKLKIHTPLPHILANTPAETRAKLPPHCWIIT